jgi:DNA repair protein RecO (recombination protein O)
MSDAYAPGQPDLVGAGWETGGVALYRDEGVVLRVQKLGEADRIVTLLTRRNGRVRAVGKGVRRTTSRFGARLEPFSHVDLQLWTGRSLDIVTQAETLGAYGKDIVGDYGRYTAATAVLETAERLTAEEREPALRLYLLVVGALRGLAVGAHDPSLVLDAFLVRAMSAAGWEPALAECARCGTPGPHQAFSVPAGGAVCADCRPAGSSTPDPESVALMVALLSGDWGTAEASGTAARREASGLVAAHLQWHLERGLRSLPLVERARP